MSRDDILKALDNIESAMAATVSRMAVETNSRQLAMLSGQLDQLDTGELRLRVLLSQSVEPSIL